MSKLYLYIAFYKSTLLYSISFSIAFTAFGLFSSWQLTLLLFAAFFMTGGSILTLLHKEISLRNEYYFYWLTED